VGNNQRDYKEFSISEPSSGVDRQDWMAAEDERSQVTKSLSSVRPRIFHFILKAMGYHEKECIRTVKWLDMPYRKISELSSVKDQMQKACGKIREEAITALQARDDYV
jgi:hypothetical protein